MFLSAPRFNAPTRKAALALSALSLFAAPIAYACDDLTENLGNGWSGMTEYSEGTCYILKDDGKGRGMSHYADAESRGGYWTLTLTPNGAEIIGGDDVPLDIYLNGKKASSVTAMASGEPGDENWGGYQDFIITDGQLDKLVAGKTKGFKLEARMNGKAIYTFDATGAEQAFAAYRTCHENLTRNWDAQPMSVSEAP